MNTTERECDIEGRLTLTENEVKQIRDMRGAATDRTYQIMVLLVAAGYGKNPETAAALYTIADMIMLAETINNQETADAH